MRARPALRLALLAGGALVGVAAAAVIWPRSGPPPPAGPAVDVPALRVQALGLQAAGNYAEAEQAVQRWRAACPDDVEPHLRLVDLGVRSGRLPAAIDGARAALRLRPDDDALRQQLAGWLLGVGRTDEALAEVRRCRRSSPDDVRLRLLEAIACVRVGDRDEAGRLVDAILRDHPRLPLAVLLRGELCLAAGQAEQAVAPLSDALAEPGEHQLRARYLLGLALARTGREAEARQHLAQVQRQQTVGLWEKYGRSDSPAYQVSLAESLLATQQTAEGVRLLEEVVARSPDCAAAHRLLARHYDAAGRADRAAEHRRRAGE